MTAAAALRRPPRLSPILAQPKQKLMLHAKPCTPTQLSHMLQHAVTSEELEAVCHAYRSCMTPEQLCMAVAKVQQLISSNRSSTLLPMVLESCLQQLKPHLAELSLQQLAAVASSLGSMSYQCDDALMQALSAAAAAKMQLQQKASDIVAAARAFGCLVVPESADILLTAASSSTSSSQLFWQQLSSTIASSSHSFAPAELQELVVAVAVARQQDAGVVQAVCNACKARLQSFSSEELAHLASCVSNLGCADEQVQLLMEAAAVLMVDRVQQQSRRQQQEQQMAAWRHQGSSSSSSSDMWSAQPTSHVSSISSKMAHAVGGSTWAMQVLQAYDPALCVLALHRQLLSPEHC